MIKDNRKWSTLGTLSDDQRVFAQHLANAGAMHAQLGNVVGLLASKIPAAQDSFRSWEVKQAANHSSLVSLEMMSCEEVPFESKDVYRALRALTREKSDHVHENRSEVCFQTIGVLWKSLSPWWLTLCAAVRYCRSPISVRIHSCARCT